MKQSILRLTIAALLASASVASLSAATITLNADDLLGWVSPSNPNTPENHTEQTNFFIEAYNLGTADGTNLGNNVDDPQSETNWFYRPDGAPANLAAAVISGTSVNTSNPVVDLGGFTYQYILFKQNTDAWVYYIGDIAGTNSINWGGNPLTNPDASNENGSQISHYVLFNKSAPTPTQHSVPDGGTTVLLVGAGLLLTAFAARQKKSA
jgi:hypothetical protein